MKKFLAALPIAAMIAWFLPVGPASAQESFFTCRAAPLRVTAPVVGTVEPVFAPRPAQPGGRCVTDFEQLIGIPPPGTAGVTAGLLTAQTEVGADFARASSEVVGARIADATGTLVSASVLGSNANVRCVGGQPVFTGSAHVVQLFIRGVTAAPVTVAFPANTTITVPVANVTIVINEQIQEPNRLTVRALRVSAPLLSTEVIVAESIADVTGNPCNGSPTPTTTQPINPIPECSDEIDNDGDGLIDFGRDPGCSSPQDDDETDVGGERPPQCQDGQDNDGDGYIDYPFDPGCVDRRDNDERDNQPPTDARECTDGRDNDRDGTIDGGDAGCKSPADDDEANGFVTGGGGYRQDDRNLEPPGATDDVVKGGIKLNAGSYSEPCDIGDKPAGPPLVSGWHGNPDEEENVERADAQWKSFTTTRAYCRNDPFIDPENPRSELDTGVFEGVGTLKIKGPTAEGQTTTAYALWMVQDRGEPGAPPVRGIDLYEIYVCFGETRAGCTNSHTDPDVLYSGSQTLDHGNVQAHSYGGATRPTATQTPTATSTPSRGKGGKKPRGTPYVPAVLDPIAAHALWARR